MTEPEVPSARRVLLQALRAQTAVVAKIPAEHILLHRPAGTWPAYAVLVLTNVDEIESPAVGNGCRVQADLWAGSIDASGEEEIEDIAPTVQAASRGCDGDWPAGKIRKCRAPNRLPSPEQSGRGRIIIDFELDVTA